VDEFTSYIQPRIRRILPVSLSARLDPPDNLSDVIFPSEDCSSDSDQTQAEMRMQKAYEEGGVVKLGRQIWLEFEREWEESRKYRIRKGTDHKSDISSPVDTSPSTF
jgi:hypothetical protein